ncbi:hypothetical protein GCM10009548_70900 [Streptomyces malaysiensis subsp. malaysiensis]
MVKAGRVSRILALIADDSMHVGAEDNRLLPHGTAAPVQPTRSWRCRGSTGATAEWPSSGRPIRPDGQCPLFFAATRYGTVRPSNRCALAIDAAIGTPFTTTRTHTEGAWTCPPNIPTQP